MNLKQRAAGILDKSIVEVFPELQGHGIRIEIIEDPTSLFYKSHKTIGVDGFLEMANDKAIQGGILHELAHIYMDSRMNFLQAFLDTIRFTFSSSYRTQQEREVDMLIVKRGHADKLYELIKFHDRHFEKYNKTDGLTKKELKKIVNSSK